MRRKGGINMSEIDARCQKIANVAQKHLIAKEIAQKQARQLLEKAGKDSMNNLLAKLYDKLHEHIYGGCGLGTETSVFIEDVSSYGQEIIDAVAKGSGLKLGLDEGAQAWLNVEFSGTPKRYVLKRQLQDGQEERVFDFAKLVAESNRRVALWHEGVNDLAEHCIQIIVDCLESRAENHYGIPQTIIVEKNRQNAFATNFDFCGLKLEFGKLQPWQVSELEAAINKRISHGAVEAKRVGTFTHSAALWFELTKKTKKVVEDAIFDYAEFYHHYDEVTPELQNVIQKISENLQMVPEEDQLLALKPQSKLLYYIDTEEDWDNLQTAFGSKYGFFKDDLIVAIEKALPGVMIKSINFQQDTKGWVSPRGCAYGHFSENQRMEFDCESVADGCDIARRMVKARERIYDLKTSQFSSLVDAATEKLLSIVETILLRDFSPDLNLLLQYSFFLDSQVDFIVLVDGCKVDLTKINDEELSSRLVWGIKQRTKGLFEIDSRFSKIHLNVSSRN